MKVNATHIYNSEQAAKGINTPVLKCNSNCYKHSWLIFFFFFNTELLEYL